LVTSGDAVLINIHCFFCTLHGFGISGIEENIGQSRIPIFFEKGPVGASTFPGDLPKCITGANNLTLRMGYQT
jgi:hypothetical protein